MWRSSKWVVATCVGMIASTAPAWADCSTPYTSDMLLEDLMKVETALRSYDNDGAGQAAAQMETNLACLAEAPLPPMIVGRAYRAVGGGLYAGGNLRRASDWFATAIAVDPTFAYGMEDLPANHPVLNVYAEAQRLGNDEPVTMEGALGPGSHFLDGKKISTFKAIPGIPHIYQWNKDGTIQPYLITGAEFPKEAVAAPVVVAAPPPADAKKGKDKSKPEPVAKAEPAKPAAKAEEPKPAKEPKPETVAKAEEPKPAKEPKPAPPPKAEEPKPAKPPKTETVAKAEEPKPAKEAKPAPPPKAEEPKPAKEPKPEVAKAEPAKPAPAKPAPAPAKPAAAKPSPAKPATASASGTIGRKRPPEKTPLMVVGGAMVASSIGMYVVAAGHARDFEQAVLIEDVEGAQKRANTWVLVSAASLAVGSGLATWGVVLDGTMVMPTVRVRF